MSERQIPKLYQMIRAVTICVAICDQCGVEERADGISALNFSRKIAGLGWFVNGPLKNGKLLCPKCHSAKADRAWKRRSPNDSASFTPW